MTELVPEQRARSMSSPQKMHTGRSQSHTRERGPTQRSAAVRCGKSSRGKLSRDSSKLKPACCEPLWREPCVDGRLGKLCVRPRSPRRACSSLSLGRKSQLSSCSSCTANEAHSSSVAAHSRDGFRWSCFIFLLIRSTSFSPSRSVISPSAIRLFTMFFCNTRLTRVARSVCVAVMTRASMGDSLSLAICACIRLSCCCRIERSRR
mmetsp:Transcript_21508/g.45417  ORF Transcript_21508/g.45417 Transcript_21508/m.45417 type:complete len:206 (+) Transcript_21508:777-1394(+)